MHLHREMATLAVIKHELRKEIVYLTTHLTTFFNLRLYGVGQTRVKCASIYRPLRSLPSHIKAKYYRYIASLFQWIGNYISLEDQLFPNPNYRKNTPTWANLIVHNEIPNNYVLSDWAHFQYDASVGAWHGLRMTENVEGSHLLTRHAVLFPV